MHSNMPPNIAGGSRVNIYSSVQFSVEVKTLYSFRPLSTEAGRLVRHAQILHAQILSCKIPVYDGWLARLLTATLTVDS